MQTMARGKKCFLSFRYRVPINISLMFLSMCHKYHISHNCMLHLWAHGEHKPDKALMRIFVTTDRNTPLFNIMHHLLTVLEKYWVLTKVEMNSSLYQYLTRDHKQSLQSQALSPEYSQQHSSVRAFLLVIHILEVPRHPTM